MASMANAFAALNAIGSGQAPAAGKKKKSKSKAKAPADTQDAGEAAPAQAGVVEVGEACAVLDRSARTFRAGSDRVKLWKDWMKQAADRSSKAISYADADGAPLDFKQVMLRSRALEITVESCLSAPPAPEHAADLQRLLASFLPAPAAAAPLVAAVARLAALLADDAASFDTLGAAQRAVHALLGSLKAEEPAAAGAAGGGAADRLAAVDRDMAKEQGFLSKVSQGGVTKEHLSSALRLVELQNEKLELLQGGADSASGARRAATDSLEELRAAISNHLHVAQAQEGGAKGGGGAEAARGAALASLQREEAKLADQANKLHAEVRALEAKLKALRAQVAEVEDQRQRLQQRQSAAREATGGQQLGNGKPAAPSLGAAHYLEELAAADALMAVADPAAAAASSPDLADARAANADAPARYLALVRQLLGLGLSALQETPQKIALARTRLAQADKLSLLASTSKDAAVKAAKQREEGERQLAEAMRAAEAVVAQCAAALDGARRRMAALARGAPDAAAALGPAARELEDLMAHARAQLDVAAVVSAGGSAPAAGAAAPPAAAAPFLPAPGPIAPPAAAAPAAVANGNGAAKQQPAAKPRPAAAPLAPAAAADDGAGFQQVASKKGRGPRAQRA
ncbi:hypothetical protein Rsub_04269 [Raphidocelis subcapitata]|uniref:Uncharacterized protein n=1 Tax=Raphidocelis subcapitata TaxID=307507 RepID=A0A2V0NW24_9CHLO|nr:hypothetical protein Rsub_04269 [Raphidocelis subcapitata]|eukprot:GBF91529.1 hypothetical protein Rsub_04269 [Raphidocelis subcapitata]